MKLYYVLFLFISINALESNKFILPLLGNQRSGRSCFINNFLKITDNKIAKIGEDDGETTTLDVDLYEGSNEYIDEFQFRLIDTKGFENSLERDIRTIFATFQELCKNYKKLIRIDAILFFYSVKKDAITLERDLKILKLVLGDEVLNEVVIIFTKASNEKNMFRNLEKIADGHNVRFLYLESKCEEKVGESFSYNLKKHLDVIRKYKYNSPSYLSLENIKMNLSILKSVAFLEYHKNIKNNKNSKKEQMNLNVISKLDIVVDYLADKYKMAMNNNLYKQQEDLVHQEQIYSLIVTLAVILILSLGYYLYNKRIEIWSFFTTRPPLLSRDLPTARDDSKECEDINSINQQSSLSQPITGEGQSVIHKNIPVII